MTDNDRRQHRKRWRKDDENYVRTHIGESDESLARRFGRTTGAIRTLKERLKHKKTNRK